METKELYTPPQVEETEFKNENGFAASAPRYNVPSDTW